MPTAQEMVKEAVLPAANFNFERNIEVEREVLMSPFGLLFTDFTKVMLLEPDFPVMEQVALRALETVKDNFLPSLEAFDLNRRDTDDFGLATVPASFNTGNLYRSSEDAANTVLSASKGMSISNAGKMRTSV